MLSFEERKTTTGTTTTNPQQLPLVKARSMSLIKTALSQVWWGPVTWEAEESQVQGHPGQLSETLSQNKKHKGLGTKLSGKVGEGVVPVLW